MTKVEPATLCLAKSTRALTAEVEVDRIPRTLGEMEPLLRSTYARRGVA